MAGLKRSTSIAIAIPIAIAITNKPLGAISRFDGDAQGPDEFRFRHPASGIWYPRPVGGIQHPASGVGAWEFKIQN
jgi:hypothetical protein